MWLIGQITKWSRRVFVQMFACYFYENKYRRKRPRCSLNLFTRKHSLCFVILFLRLHRRVGVRALGGWGPPPHKDPPPLEATDGQAHMVGSGSSASGISAKCKTHKVVLL